MKGYDSYKESGIDGIGSIPKGWHRTKLKNLVCQRITDGPHETPEWTDNGVPFISAEAIRINVIDLAYKRGYISEEQHAIYSKKSKVQKGDILFCKSGSTTGKSAYVDIEEEFGIWSPLAIIRASKEKADGRFLFSFIQSSVFKYQVETNWTFGTQPNIGMGALENLWIAFPESMQEQTQIAKYLDYKTQQIDDLIAKKEQLIKLLEEERTALINELVTGKKVWDGKGFSKPTKTKDSGIDWLGEIPEDWEVKKLKRVFKFSTGLSITRENLSNSGVPCINYGEIHSKYGFEVNPEKDYLKCVNEGYLESSTKSLLKKGDFVFADTSEDIEGCGNFSHVTGEAQIFAGYHTVIAQPLVQINARFFAYIFTSQPFRNQVRSSVKGIKVFSVTQSILKNTTVWMPTLENQRRISETIKLKEGRIKSAVDKMVSEIDLLKEYKKSLISEVVTGKVDVRNEVIPEEN
ncbi:restriction endonuclease subunit S [Luteibaculum oceani]|uniref:Restriction endonuclease subunit S n=1 Tax=Luteibaculum oceani TaxID=1294296 RepID=A0A5C6V0S3_9FLAO|nr:restriction endonuclease subunit S [Luteibaculum oceani]TXC78769.1 restriction endonuclease subunit S [Luteibaculum oceani]